MARRAQKLEKEESLRDLIETRSAREGIAPRELWRLTLRAILKKDPVLLTVLPDPRSLDTGFSHGGMPLAWQKVFEGALKDIDHYLPTKDFWAKAVKLDSDAFDEWLTSPKQASRLPKRRRPTYAKVKAVVLSYTETERNEGRSTSVLRMWDHLKQNLSGATREEGKRALREIEGGAKGRGRPQKHNVKRP